MTKKTVLSIMIAMAFVGFGCTDTDVDDGNYGVSPEFSVTKEALTAYCSIAVEGYGTVEMETDYVPNVTWCENGNAPDQALNAQSAAARTFAYYKISTGGTPVKNSQGDQVYKCPGRTPSQQQLNRCINATNATSGYVMTYKGKITAGFYVSGVKPDYLNSECKFTGSSSSAGYVGVQDYVTYNWGKSGGKADGFKQTSLGWVNDGNYANRGCMAQNGATCLANNGWEWMNILRFFYGADINIEKASGNCVTSQTKCETTLSKSGTIIDDLDPCFTRAASESWYVVDGGYNNHLYYTYVWDKAAEAIGTWNINVTRPGTYEVFAYIQSGVGAVSEKAPYKIRASGKETKVSINLSGKSGWVSLGKYTFANGGDQWVKLSDDSGEPYTDKNGKRILFDAIKFEDAVICQNACTEGAKQCSGNGVQTCSKGSNGCTAWGSVAACGAKEKCDGGKCVAACNDECSSKGTRECSGNGYRVCGEYDSDACLEWSGVTACGSGEKCEKGACVTSAPTCQDECTAGTAKCDGNHAIVCGQFDDDTCLEFQSTPCVDAQVCVNGACVTPDPSCEHDCVENDTMCLASADVIGFMKCGDYNHDGCMEWGAEEYCKEGMLCDRGACVAPDEVWDGTIEGLPEQCLTEIDGRPSTIIDDKDACFVRSSSMSWSELKSFGYNDHLYYAYATDVMPSAVGTWYLKVTKGGKYSIYAYVESGVGSVSEQAPYLIKAADAEHSLSIDMTSVEGWVKLGDYDLSVGQLHYVQLMDSTGEVVDNANKRRVLFDAIKVVPYGSSEIEPDEPVVVPGGDDGHDLDDELVPASVAVYSSSSCSGTPLNGGGSVPFAVGCLFGCFLLRRRQNAGRRSK